MHLYVGSDGSNYINVSAIFFRWRGAEYHCALIKDIAQNLLGSKYDPSIGDPRLHWHLHSFYWELAATFDCTLQLIAASHKLQVYLREINWDSKFKKALSDAGIDNDVTQKLYTIEKSDWYRRIKRHRKFTSHWSNALVQILTDHHKSIIAIGPAGKLHLVQLCENDLQEMKHLINIVRNTYPHGDVYF